MNKILTSLLVLLGIGFSAVAETKLAAENVYGTKRVIVGKTTYSGTDVLQISGNASFSKGTVSVNAMNVSATLTANKLVAGSPVEAGGLSSEVLIGGVADSSLGVVNNTGVQVGVRVINGVAQVGTQTSSTLNLVVNNSSQAVILSNGNVGIGTTAPLSKLQVEGATSINGTLAIGGLLTGIASNYVANFKSTAASAYMNFTPNGQKQWRIGAGLNAVGDFGFYNETDNNNSGLYMLANGNTGIGTTAPSTKLEVAGVISANDFARNVITNISANCTFSGWSSFTQQVVYVKMIGKTIKVHFDIRGTSNGANADITLPSYLAAGSIENIISFQAISVHDNGAYIATPGSSTMTPSSATITCYKDFNSGAFTSSGVKMIRGTILYEIN